MIICHGNLSKLIQGPTAILDYEVNLNGSGVTEWWNGKTEEVAGDYNDKRTTSLALKYLHIDFFDVICYSALFYIT